MNIDEIFENQRDQVTVYMQSITSDKGRLQPSFHIKRLRNRERIAELVEKIIQVHHLSLKTIKYITKHPELTEINTRCPVCDKDMKHDGRVQFTCSAECGYRYSQTHLHDLKDRNTELALEYYGHQHQNSKSLIRKKHRENRYQLFTKILTSRNIEMLSEYSEYLVEPVLRFKCLQCGTEFDAAYSSSTTSNRIWCPNCHALRSLGEEQIYQYVAGIIGADKILRNKRKIIPNHSELDIYIPEKHLAIEFDSLKFHHSQVKDKNYHVRKTLECLKQGIQLLHVFGDEWFYRQNIVKSIIANRLGIYQQTIRGEDCEIRELTISEYYAFLEINDLRGYQFAGKRLGMIHDGKLVACIGVEDGVIVRFCTKINTLVIDVLKLLVDNIVEKHLIAYADLQYSIGKEFKETGFSFVRRIGPEFSYAEKTPRLGTYNCGKLEFSSDQ